MERLSDKERERLGELLAEGAPAWRMHQEVHRSRWAIRRAINALRRPPTSESTQRLTYAVDTAPWSGGRPSASAQCQNRV
jgi:hypothetical protein